MKRLLYFLFAFLFSVPFLQAQCPPPGFPDSGNTCEEAPVLCENLDGYCNTINNNNVVQDFPGCSNQWTLNNDEWFAFYAGTTTISIMVTPSNCSQDGGLLGLQGGIYHGCGGPVMDVQCACTEEPFTLTATNYIVGEIYWFVLDGCNGNVCDYSIDVVAGSTIGAPPNTPAPIVGPSAVCGGNITNYSVPPVTGATVYNWSLTPPNAGEIIGGNDNTVTVEWDNTFTGNVDLCLNVANVCYANPNTVCRTIELVPVPTAEISGGGIICQSGAIDLQVSFTGSGPWRFTPIYNGTAQTPIETSQNPYTLQVTQGGVWQISFVYNSLNCLGTTSGFSIVTLDTLSLSATTTDAVCGQSNGAIDLTISNGPPPYTIHWSNNAVTEDLFNLGSGIYTVQVTDSLGCSNMLSVTVGDSLRTDTVGLCPGASILLGGQSYSQPGIVIAPNPGGSGCDSLVRYVLIPLTNPTRSDTIEFCANHPVLIGNQTYTESGTVQDTLAAAVGCDTIVTYTLIRLDLPTSSKTISFCPGGSVVLGGQTYTQPGTVTLTVPATSGCDTVVTYTLTLLPQPTASKTIEFCPGESVVLGGQTYTQPGTVTLTIPATSGCDTIATYTLVLLPQPTASKTIEFCPGESVVLGGQTYTQPGTVTLTIPATSGCDTIATFHLVSKLPAPSTVSVKCPVNISTIADPGTAPLIIDYADPTTTTDCPCPGMTLDLTAGLLSGAAFPNGTTNVCYRATDACGHTATCCFSVTVREVQPCDVKVIGCMRYELLSITADAAKNQTYRIKVENSCTNKMIYTAIQLPDAVIAMEPPHLSVYTAESGNKYEVRNPNYSPFYSIRFRSITDSISNGESDIFKYTLPAQSDPDYIHVTSRLVPQLFFEAYLNTFYCPVGMARPGESTDRSEEPDAYPWLFPNPTEGAIWVDPAGWSKNDCRFRILDNQGRMMTEGVWAAGEGAQRIELPVAAANGLYFIELYQENGNRAVQRFVLQR